MCKQSLLFQIFMHRQQCFNTSFHLICLPLKQGTHDSISEHALMGFSSHPKKIKLHWSDRRVIVTYFILLNSMVNRERQWGTTPLHIFYEVFCHTGKSHKESAQKGTDNQNPQNSCSKTEEFLKYSYYPLSQHPWPFSLASTLHQFPNTLRYTNDYGFYCITRIFFSK